MTAPGPDLVRAVRAGCNAIGEPNCKFPDCDCARVRSIRAALAELAAPSKEMLSAVPNYRHLAEHCWRAMMRRLLGEGEWIGCAIGGPSGDGDLT